MAAGKINLQANDGKVLGLYAPDGMSANTDIIPASVNGDATKVFKVADAVNADEAVSKVQMETAISNSGKVLQVVQAVKNDVFSSSSASWVDIPSLSVSITPKKATSKILVLVSMVMGTNGAYTAAGRLMRDTTPIAVPPTVSGYTSVSTASAYSGGTDPNVNNTLAINYVDTPNTISQVNYKMQINSLQGAIARVNALGSDASGQTWSQRSISTITVMEIGV